jgi:hypothetical protein
MHQLSLKGEITIITLRARRSCAQAAHTSHRTLSSAHSSKQSLQAWTSLSTVPLTW